MTKIKICGLRRRCDISYVNEYKPDFAGFLFAESKRRVTPDEARELKKELSPEICAVGVFVNEKPEVIAGLVNEGVIDMVQLHGDEREQDILELRKLIGDTVIIRAVRVGSAKDLAECEKTAADYLLFDAKSHVGYGGSGTTFDWDLIQHIKKPYFLAGGMCAGNVKEAIRALHPFAVDVSSAVETEGFKDREKIREMIEAVKDNNLED